MVDVDQVILGVNMIQVGHLVTLRSLSNAKKNLLRDRLVIATLSNLDIASSFR